MNPFPYMWQSVMSEAVRLLVMNTDRMTKVTYGDMLCLPAPVMLRTQYGTKKKKRTVQAVGTDVLLWIQMRLF